jgi:hypothetical protein
MTLPQLGLNGLPVPGGDVGAEDVPGELISEYQPLSSDR